MNDSLYQLMIIDLIIFHQNVNLIRFMPEKIDDATIDFKTAFAKGLSLNSLKTKNI